jgi:hypothetical protein
MFALPSFASCVPVFAVRSGAGCGWDVDPAFVRQSFEQMLCQGTIAALVGAAAGAAAAGALRRREAPAPVIAS